MIVMVHESDLNRIRQWFDHVQDTDSGYLETEDYDLAKEIYVRLGWEVPQSIWSRTSAATSKHRERT